MFDRARQWPDRPMLRSYHDGAWQAITWGQFARQAASVARTLRRAGVSAGDRVVIVSENRPEFPIVETALMAIRAVPVPTYTTNTVDDHAHILRDSGARAAVASTAALAAKLALAGPLDVLVVMEPFSSPGVPVLAWQALVQDESDPADIAAEAATIAPGALACLIYTSGTGGAPKGVMLPHRAILSNCRGAFDLVRPLRLRDETYLSFLPLSHSYEHTVGQFFLLSVGSEVVYARGVEHLAADMLAVRPTIMTMVPRVLEVIRARILGQVARQPAWQRALFDRALRVGRRRAEGQPLSPLDRLLDPLLERLVRRKVRARFGGRLRAAISGGARLEPEVGRFFLGLGVAMLQGYGQTEAGPVIAANPPDACRIDSVGKTLAGVELRIAADGEILVRGDLVMDGYWQRPGDTTAAIRDGWLHTGDIGTLDADGYLRITDRKKDMIVLSGGENVSPARIEGMLIAEPAIAQAVVLGEGRAGLTALVVPHEGCDELAVAAAVAEVNARLSVTERIRRHAVVPPFTVDNRLMTATQKIRRHLVAEAHADVLARLGA
ncbi:long-chain fatty acid--CoA ligase [Rhodovastum sp. RN2-1]|uniref:Long-chain fatty acid--CoA ligase n=2 Tax=Limobrevibacterium gyesilva TaxID=2991712 RepID=A0AA41YR67_9PROT|nr:long-chain fatty acid--CoA ligase [Limobrevibacterium gyesilva]